MKKFYWFPKLIAVKLKEEYWDGKCPPDDNGMTTYSCTFSPAYYWVGKEYYKWLWFEYEKRLVENKDFEVYNKTMNFINVYPKGTLISIEHNYARTK
jgi:hypothetical protein